MIVAGSKIVIIRSGDVIPYVKTAEDCRRQSAQPKQSAVVTAVRELLAVEVLDGQVKAALVD